MHFGGATQIVNLYHDKEHVDSLAALLAPTQLGSPTGSPISTPVTSLMTTISYLIAGKISLPQIHTI